MITDEGFNLHIEALRNDLRVFLKLGHSAGVLETQKRIEAEHRKWMEDKKPKIQTIIGSRRIDIYMRYPQNRTESVSRSMRQLHADLLLIHRHIEIYWQPHFWDEFELISTNAHSFNVMPHEAEYIETRILEAVESVRTALDSLYQAA